MIEATQSRQRNGSPYVKGAVSSAVHPSLPEELLLVQSNACATRPSGKHVARVVGILNEASAGIN